MRTDPCVLVCVSVYIVHKYKRYKYDSAPEDGEYVREHKCWVCWGSGLCRREVGGGTWLVASERGFCFLNGKIKWKFSVHSSQFRYIFSQYIYSSRKSQFRQLLVELEQTKQFVKRVFPSVFDCIVDPRHTLIHTYIGSWSVRAARDHVHISELSRISVIFAVRGKCSHQDTSGISWLSCAQTIVSPQQIRRQHQQQQQQ